MTIKQWLDYTYGKRYDMDRVYGFQCWDFFAYFIYYFSIPVSTYCKLTHFVGDLWKLRYEYGYNKYFHFITNINEVRDGDWVFWDKHVAMFYRGMQYGQNQLGYAQVTAEPFPDGGVFLGAMRYKSWETNDVGVAHYFNVRYAGPYTATCDVNFRRGGSVKYSIIQCLKKGTEVRCYGYYEIDESNRIWLYCTCGSYLGFICADYLTKQ